ncbi:hypothetical protein EC973_005431 [Apophysomyces ossiformis]|uniref:Peptide hydrolase n=1 Tax=Apophysomyces ossiformis TaxID=679940 RepID=A0A8H7BPB5_9FUNG|nr:hypothetical protein EC973_005431 [Apophysomyces ossiformis]
MPSEETPLLPPRRLAVKAHTLRTYGFIFSFLFFLALAVQCVRTTLPTTLSDVEAEAFDDFAGLHAYNEYLSKFNAPHPVNSRANGDMRDWLASVAEELKVEAKANGVKLEVVRKDPIKATSKSFFSDDGEYWFVDSRNVIVRLQGQSNRDEAVMINAHYDSVPTSHGVTDNGMGVAVTLELLRYFVHHPPRNTIIFLFNNFEEGGLIGAKAFIKHPWWSSVKLFINLEGAGAGGRALLFRASNQAAVAHLAWSNARFVHGSPLGNDMFKAKLLKSDTDYSVFTAAGTPGLDIAFYAPRSHYHTPRDTLAYTTPNALQHMGQMTLNAVRNIANSDDLTNPVEEEKMIFYDVLGRWMFVYSFGTYQAVNIIALIAVFILAIISTKKNEQLTTRQRYTKQASMLSRELLATIISLVAIVLSIVVAVTIVSYLNPSMSYGNTYSAVLYIFSAAVFGLLASQPLCERLSKAPRSLSSQVDTTLAVILCSTIPAGATFRLPAVFLAQILLPTVLMIEFCLLSVDSMRHSTPDGTPEIAVYGLLSISISLIVLQLRPWIAYAGDKRKATILSGIILLLVFIICWSLPPFNGGWSPNKFVFDLHYNQSEPLATVSLVTATGLPAMLKPILRPTELETLTCDPVNKYQTKCTYQTDLLPKYAQDADEYKWDFHKACDSKICRVNGTFVSKNSLLCRIAFDSTDNYKAWVGSQDITEGPIGSLISYTDRYEKDVHWGLEYSVDSDRQATLGCYYDEWSNGELPAFSDLRNRLPESVLLLHRGQGLSLVQYAQIYNSTTPHLSPASPSVGNYPLPMYNNKFTRYPVTMSMQQQPQQPQQQLQQQQQQPQKIPQTIHSLTPGSTPTHAPNTTPHLARQLTYAQISRQSASPHHHARTAAAVARNAPVASTVTIVDPNNPAKSLNGLLKKQEDHQRLSTASNCSWTALDVGGMGLKNISPSLFSYTFLTILYMSHNELTGLPAAIANLVNLKILDASGNKLESLPSELGMLINLRELLLFDNNLTDLPNELGTLYQLEILGLEGNPMNEEIKNLLLKDGSQAVILSLRDQAPG